MPKQARLSRIKSLYCYRFDEAAEVCGVTSRTISNWAANGLHVLDDNHPPLIRGDDLKNHIKNQRKGRKVKTDQYKVYCVCCKKARSPAGRMADCLITGNRAILTALCEVCETVISKPVAKARIPEIARTLEVTIKRLDATL